MSQRNTKFFTTHTHVARVGRGLKQIKWLHKCLRTITRLSSLTVPVSELPGNEKSPSLLYFACSTFQEVCLKMSRLWHHKGHWHLFQGSVTACPARCPARTSKVQHSLSVFLQQAVSTGLNMLLSEGLWSFFGSLITWGCFNEVQDEK